MLGRGEEDLSFCELEKLGMGDGEAVYWVFLDRV